MRSGAVTLPRLVHHPASSQASNYVTTLATPTEEPAHPFLTSGALRSLGLAPTLVRRSGKLARWRRSHGNQSSQKLGAPLAHQEAFEEGEPEEPRPRPVWPDLSAMAEELEGLEELSLCRESRRRIEKWLEQVKGADAVTTQVVEEERPTQTDTSIHVHYRDD